MIVEGTFSYLVAGIFFGLSAGLSPGPLLALVISETVKHNRREGIKVALTPLVTDVPILLISVFILSGLSRYEPLLGFISLAGGVFITHLAWESLRSKGFAEQPEKGHTGSLKKGIVVNILSPHPYLFWITVGVPILLKAFQVNLLTGMLFLLSFYALLVGSKVGVALLVDRSRAFIHQKVYVRTMQILGIALLIFALLFFWEGLDILYHSLNL